MKKTNKKRGAILGQHFLKDKNSLQKIIDSSNLNKDDTVLEIGPGQGALTEYLLKTGAQVIGIEKDTLLIPYLQQKFSKEILSGQLILIEQDILSFSPEKTGAINKKYKIIANIPYYITGLIIRKFLDGENKPSDMVFLVQKEVAERIIAKDKKESLLSISVKIFGNPKIIGIVKAGAFSPPPKVDSAILVIENISNKNLEGGDKKTFFEILKAGFSHKRKLLASNLKQIWKNPIINMTSCGIKENARGEDIKLNDWICLWKNN